MYIPYLSNEIYESITQYCRHFKLYFEKKDISKGHVIISLYIFFCLVSLKLVSDDHVIVAQFKIRTTAQI